MCASHPLSKYNHTSLCGNRSTKYKTLGQEILMQPTPLFTLLLLLLLLSLSHSPSTCAGHTPPNLRKRACTLKLGNPKLAQNLHLMEPVPRPDMPLWWSPTKCGTLNLKHPDTSHCFPPDASKFTFCCEYIKLPEPGENPVLDSSDLASRIRAASDPSNLSWCTCSEYVCEELLGGKVTWDQNSREAHLHAQP
jgi:hypothetical protein